MQKKNNTEKTSFLNNGQMDYSIVLHESALDNMNQKQKKTGKNINQEKINKLKQIFNGAQNKEKIVKRQNAKNSRFSKRLTFEEDQVNQEIEDIYIDYDNEENCDVFSLDKKQQFKKQEAFDKKLTNLKLNRIRNEDNCYVKIVEMSNLEKLQVYNDKYPFLSFRKAILKYYYYFSNICYTICKSPIFEFVSICVILVNSVLLMMDDPLSKTSLSDKNEYNFMLFYTAEITFKVFGFGFFSKPESIFRDWWNFFDFIIVCSSQLNVYLQDSNIQLSALRTLRVLRPLKTISAIKKLKNLIQTIFKSIPYLIDILIILLFVYLMYAIGGLHLYHGIMKKRCVSLLDNSLLIPEKICNDDDVCPIGYMCLKNFSNPDFGVTNFDNFGSAFLMVFQITTLEGWFPILDKILNAYGSLFQFFSILYFISLVFIGNFFILNLMLAVITHKFNESQKNQNNNNKSQKHKKQCICNKGVNFHKLKLSGQFQKLSRIEAFHRNSLKHNGLLSTHKHNNMMSFEIEKQDGKQRTLDSLYSKLSWEGNEIDYEELEQQYQNRKNIDLMIESYNGLVKDMQNAKKKMSFNPIQFKVAPQITQKDFEYKRSCIKYSKKHTKNLHGFMNNVENDDFQKEMLDVVLDQQSEQFKPKFHVEQQPFNKEQQKTFMMSPINNVKSNVNDLKGNLSVIGTIIKRNKTKNFQKKYFDKKTEKQIQELKKINPKYLKIYVDFCKCHQRNILFDSTYDVLPSKKPDSNKTFKEQKSSNHLHIKYDTKGIIEEEKMISIHKLKRKIQFEDNICMNYDLSALQDVQIPEDYQFWQDEYIQQEQYVFVPEHLKLQEIYYPLRQSQSNIRLIKKDQKQNNYITKNSNLQNQDRDVLVEHKKKVKQICKNFSNLSEYFRNEFQDKIQQKNQIIEAEKKAIECYYNEIIKNDLQEEVINKRNWSGFDLVNIKKFPLVKLNSIIESLNNRTTEIWIPGLKGKYIIFRRYCRNFIFSKSVDTFLLALVFINTLIFSLDGLLDSKYDQYISDLNDAFTWIFLAEMVIKIIGLGIHKYMSDSFRIFDGVIVILSLIEYVIKDTFQGASALKPIKIFRSIRVLRITRLLRSLKFMKVIIQVIIESLEQFTYIALLLLLLIIIFSLIGMQLFGGKFDFYQEDEIKRQNFDNFGNAFLTVFQILTMENWNDVLYLTMRSSQNVFVSVAYLITWIFFGNYVILNLFLAILLDGFTSVSTIQALEEIKDEDEQIRKIIQQQKKIIKKRQEEQLKKEKILKDIERSDYKTQNYGNDKQRKAFLINKDDSSDQDSSNDSFESIKNEQKKLNIISSSSEDECDENVLESKLTNAQVEDNVLVYNENKYKYIQCEESLFLFKKSNKFRQIIGKLVLHPYFEKMIIILIILSSLQLIVESYKDESWENTFYYIALQVLDKVFTISFILEFLMKIITYGFFICPDSYLREAWSWLDFFIILSSIFNLIFTSFNYPFLKVLRLLRTLRPLRFLTHYENLRIVLGSLIESISGILNVLIVIIMVWVMFGILGINLLKGKMGYCDSDQLKSYYNVNYQQCMDIGGEWKNFGWNFDNIFNALTTLFVLSSFEGWPNIMFSAMDADTKENGPQAFGNYYIFIYFFSFIFMGSLFLMNLLVGVIFFQFTQEQEKEKNKKFKFVTNEQMKWVLMQRLILKAKPNAHTISVPSGKAQRYLYKIVNSKIFEIFIVLCILANIITMAVFYEGMSETQKSILDFINYIFFGIFFFEAFLKIIAFGPQRYFLQGWNQFDFLIVFSGIVEIVLNMALDITTLKLYPLIARLLRVLRIIRLFKLFKSKQFESFNKIIRTLIFSFPALMNVLMLLLLIYFIFSILGVYLFQDEYQFKNFGVAILYLFRYSTGEDWHVDMYNIAKKNPIIGQIFFLSFVFFSTFIMINMFVLIVIQQFENFYFNKDNPINSFEDITNQFRKTWSHFCIQNGQVIKHNDVYHFFVCLQAPLGFYIPDQQSENDLKKESFNVNYYQQVLRYDPNFVRRKITKMNLLVDSNGNVSFGQVLHAAMKNAFGSNSKDLDYETHKAIKQIEVSTMNKILKKTSYEKQKNKKLNRKIVNPFSNLLFIKLLYSSWYNRTKKLMKIEDMKKEGKIISDEEKSFDSGSEFEKQILSKIKKPKEQSFDELIVQLNLNSKILNK